MWVCVLLINIRLLTHRPSEINCAVYLQRNNNTYMHHSVVRATSLWRMPKLGYQNSETPKRLQQNLARVITSVI